MNTTGTTVPDLAKKVYNIISVAHEKVKSMETPKAFLTFKDCVLITNAYKFLADNTDTSVLEECRDLKKAAQILEQGVSIAQMKGMFTLEEAVVVNEVLTQFVLKVNETLAPPAPAAPAVKTTPKSRPKEKIAVSDDFELE